MATTLARLETTMDRGEIHAFYHSNITITIAMQVRCSSNQDLTADPMDTCGDRAGRPPQCPPPSVPRPPDDNVDVRLEAFSDPAPSKPFRNIFTYDRITFCNSFFNLPTLSEVISNNAGKPAAVMNDLSNYNSRARCFFHEITHLDWFMNAKLDNKDGESPQIWDAQFQYKAGRQTYQELAYGPFYTKILRNFIPAEAEDIGYWTQRNGKSLLILAKISQPLPFVGRC